MNVAPPIRAAEERGRPPGGLKAPRPPREKASLEARTILVVDDDGVTRETLRELLEEEGYRVIAATDGVDALEKLGGGQAPPSLILVDLMMPVMDGWELIAEVKRTEALARVPVVVISAGGNDLLATAPVAAGYLTKPLDLDRLLQTVGRLCGA